MINTTLSINNKRRLIISLVVLVIGLLIVGLAYTPWLNPPQCPSYQTQQDVGYTCIIGANIGAGLVWMLGIAVAVAGSIALFASLVFALVVGNNKKSRKALLITVLLVGAVLFTCWYFLIGASSIKKAAYQREVQQKYSSFVAYEGMPKLSSVSRHSNAITTIPSADPPTSIRINLDDCSPGVVTIPYATGTTHFIFSGLRKERNFEYSHASECVLYIGKETQGQVWDGLLHARCIWEIGDTPTSNKQDFEVMDMGIQFGNFLSYCQDLRTGVVPRELIQE